LTQAAQAGALPDAGGFLVESLLVPAWRRAREAAIADAEEIDWPRDQVLEPNERWLSPSDVGFHNTLDVDGDLVFIDFEYAGWDDPAKTIADFFSQPDYEVDIALFDSFVSSLTTLPAASWHGRRARAVIPLHRVKWTCIVLNDFLGDAAARRRQALGTATRAARASVQLAKARKMLVGSRAEPASRT
jgi:hypothetical protein